MWVLLTLTAALGLAGCEVFTIDDPNQVDRVSPADPTETGTPAATTVDAGEPEVRSTAAEATAPIGGDGIGPRGAGGGFLWKPEGESSGKLVVLLPSSYTGHVSACFIATSGGSVIEQGSYSGAHNGDREHYRFSKSGSSYGAVVVVADLKAGGAVHWPISSPGSRVEY